MSQDKVGFADSRISVDWLMGVVLGYLDIYPKFLNAKSPKVDVQDESCTLHCPFTKSGKLGGLLRFPPKVGGSASSVTPSPDNTNDVVFTT